MDTPQKQHSKSKHVCNLVGSSTQSSTLLLVLVCYDTIFGVGASVTGKDSSGSRKKSTFSMSCDVMSQYSSKRSSPEQMVSKKGEEKRGAFVFNSLWKVGSWNEEAGSPWKKFLCGRGSCQVKRSLGRE